MKYMTRVEDQEYVIEIDREDEITVNGERYAINFTQAADSGILSLIINSRSIEATVEPQDEHWQVLINGELYTVQVQDERAYRLARARGGAVEVTGDVPINSPMPGVIVKVPVSEGELVEKGQTVVILESMKMENELKSPRPGRVARIHVASGAGVEKNQLLVTISDPDEDT